MTDDPRVEAALSELKRSYLATVAWDEDEVREVVWQQIAAANKAAWRPISEAPKDGTPVLIWGPATSHALGPVEHHAPTVCVAAFRGGLWVGAAVSYLIWHPTHFMFLPAPPSDD